MTPGFGLGGLACVTGLALTMSASVPGAASAAVEASPATPHRTPSATVAAKTKRPSVDMKLPTLARCVGRTTLSIVAHQDDDLLFMNPALQGALNNRRCVRTVFVTAGDSAFGGKYLHDREAGSRSAYARMAGLPDRWKKLPATVAGHSGATFTLFGRPEVSLSFMRLPDGNLDGSGFPAHRSQSLQKLWQRAIPSVTSVDRKPRVITRQFLIRTLAALMISARPNKVWTQDFEGTFDCSEPSCGGRDHSDHRAVGRFVQAADSRYAATHSLNRFVGYSISARPANVDATQTAQKLSTFLTYAAHDRNVCQTELICSTSSYWPWFSRQYGNREIRGQ